METLEADLVIIGAGVVGLAVGRAAAMRGRDVIILEAEDGIAVHTSSRNSEVIHAGLYYATGSWKAKFCVAGRRALYRYLKDHGVAYKNCGKLVVAQAEEEEALGGILERARNNGVEELELISGEEARALEPALSQDITKAIRSPVSGIFDSHGYFLALQGELEDHGGMIAFGTPVESGTLTGDGVELVTGGESPARIKARSVINAAGHNATAIARRIDGPHIDHLPTPHFVKGSYFSVLGKTPFTRLIYPMPDRASLGLHLTVDLSGRGRLGPDAEWLPEGSTPPFDYRVDPERAVHFYASARRYWPGLPDGALAPDYAGVRPKIVAEGEPSGDFMIDTVDTRLINLLGMESPGLTSSLAIADHVASLLD
ncbi:NAD(P)/FAD-dependent oxidoreductase [Henriciella sp.]|uniref:NAD(P)/FAD-dependent oxidoreductase n=1 Tax=Henriciella sp. TaxID=1968823 RepID=UPI002625C749|nr:NAD(P)/FAD-dependent oxidoreductase [Henriciella sp.]